jgi:uncharacterized membrane protein
VMVFKELSSYSGQLMVVVVIGLALFSISFFLVVWLSFWSSGWVGGGCFVVCCSLMMMMMFFYLSFGLTTGKTPYTTRGKTSENNFKKNEISKLKFQKLKFDNHVPTHKNIVTKDCCYHYHY